MSNAAYAAELAGGFLSDFAATRSRKKKKKKLANEVFSSLQTDDRMEDLWVGFGKNYLCQNIFDQFSVLRLMDLEGGSHWASTVTLHCMREVPAQHVNPLC